MVPDGPIVRMHPWGDRATNIHRAIWREAVRVRLTGVPSLTPLLAIAPGAVIGGLFLLALRYPDRVRAVGLPDVAGWAGLMWLTTQISVAAGLLLFCWITVRLFIKEFARKPGSARPTSRWTTIAAILIVAMRWSALFTIRIVLFGLTFGAAVVVANLSPLGSQR